MGNGLSRPLRYSCYEVAHTWTPHCSAGALDVGLSCAFESLKIYSSVYLLAELVKGKVPDWERVSKLVLGILQSTAFLSYNAFGFVWGHCFVRALLTFSNFWTVAFLPGWLASFLSIFVERPSRRAALATYVTNLASQALVSSGLNHGWIKQRRGFDIFLSCAASSLLLWLAKQQDFSTSINTAQEAVNNKGSARDGTITALGTLIGADEIACLEGVQRLNASSVTSSWMEVRHSSCPHPGSCFNASLQSFLKPLALGAVGQTLFHLLARLRDRPPPSSPLALPLTLASFGLLARASLCSMRWIIGQDRPESAALAGAIAGLASFHYRSPTIACYALWKAMELMAAHLTRQNVVPPLPFFTELVYATSTAVLFQVATLEPHSLSPSYWKFLQRITGGKMGQVNRILVDFEYGTEAAKQVRHLPCYEADAISPRLKQLIPKVGTLREDAQLR